MDSSLSLLEALQDGPASRDGCSEEHVGPWPPESPVTPATAKGPQHEDRHRRKKNLGTASEVCGSYVLVSAAGALHRLYSTLRTYRSPAAISLPNPGRSWTSERGFFGEMRLAPDTLRQITKKSLSWGKRDAISVGAFPIFTTTPLDDSRDAAEFVRANYCRKRFTLPSRTFSVETVTHSEL